MTNHTSPYGLLFIHLVGALSIAIAGGLGASAQLITELHGRQNETVAYYKRWLKMILTALGAGVVIATALLHILPDGMASLEEAGISSNHIDNSKPLQQQHEHGLFYTGIAKMHQRMIGHQIIDNLVGDGSIVVDCVPMNKKRKKRNNTHLSSSSGSTTTTSPCRQNKRPPGGVSGVGLVLLLLGFIVTYIIETEVHAVVSKAKSETIKTHIMEAGIATHSVLVGVAFGTLSSMEGARGLAIALTVHQLCEGFAMGPVIYQGAHTFLHAVVLIAIFALSTPVGVVIGVLSTYGSGSSDGSDNMGESANFAQGVLSCVASGLLLYVGLVEFLGGLLCTVHQDSWSHAVVGGDTDHVDHHPSQYHPTHKEDGDDDDANSNNNREKRGLLSSPPPRHLDGALDNAVSSYGSCAPSSTTTKGDEDSDCLDDVPMVSIVPTLPPTNTTTTALERPSSPKPACSSRGRFLQTLPAGASFPRLQTPTLRPKPAPYYFALDESISLVGLSIASSPLMYSCSGGSCVQQSPSSTLRGGGGVSFAAALEGGDGDALAASSAGCCSTDCSATQEHEHQHHHSHSGHQQRHHHHTSSCGHVADFHCVHPHLARLAVSGMVAVGAAIMALLALIT